MWPRQGALTHPTQNFQFLFIEDYNKWGGLLTDLSRCFASPVWELFHGTLYHESVLTLALPLTWHLPSSMNQSQDL